MSRKLPKLINQSEFELIFKKEKNKEIKLAMLLGFEAGMRISEIVGLRPWIIKEDGKTPIKNKIIDKITKKRSVLYFHPNTNKELKISDLRRSNVGWDIWKLSKDRINSASIFISQGKGEKDRIVPRPKRMNATAVKMLPLKVSRRTLQRHVTQLGSTVLKKQITFHTLRHGFCSHLAEMGRPLHEIQMLAGHSRLDTTGIYLHANPKKAIQGATDVF